MMAMTFIDVIMRSAFGKPIEAATELTRVFMAIMVFSALPVMTAHGKHITVDLLDHFIPEWLRYKGDAVISVICGVMLFWPAGRCRVLAERARDYGDVTEYLAIPTYFLAWFVTVSVYITAVVLGVRGVAGFFKPEILKPDNGVAAPTEASVDDTTGNSYEAHR